VDVLTAFAPEELAQSLAGALMLAVAAWLLYLDFNHRVGRAMALYLAARGTSNLIAGYFALPGALPPDWTTWARMEPYLLIGGTVAAAYVALTFADPERRARWSGLGAVALAAIAAVGLLGTTQVLPDRFPLELLTWPNPIVFFSFARYPILVAIALVLVSAKQASPPELLARRLVAVAFVLDPLFIAATGAMGVPLGIQPLTRGFFGATAAVLLTYAATLVLCAAFAWKVAGPGARARSLPGAGMLAALLAGAAVSGLAVVVVLLVAPAWTLAAVLVADAVWTGALPVLFAAAAVRGYFFGIRQKVKRSIRQSTVVTALVGVFLVAGEAARAFGPPSLAPALSLAATAGALVFVTRLQRLGESLADRALPGPLEPAEEDTRRLDGYRVALEEALDKEGRVRPDREALLASLRRQLGISDQQHAVLLYALRRQGPAAAAPRGERGLRPGEHFLDRYRVVRELGRGGNGTAYLAEDEHVRRQVVIKHLAGAGRSGNVAALLREARAVAAIRHPNVVTLYDVQQISDEAFIIMEHVEGGSLRDLLRTGPLPAADFRRVADGILAALAAVHAAGLVHRDVKPGNVLLHRDGTPKLADFGIAHLPGFETTLGGRDPGTALGSVAYMSPEQALGRTVASASDLYSAAATLYEAYTGIPYLKPQKGESAVELQMRAAMVEGFDKPLDPPALRAWFARALQPRPEDRFADAASMQRALQEALAAP
jgi:hypothetical protein